MPVDADVQTALDTLEARLVARLLAQRDTLASAVAAVEGQHLALHAAVDALTGQLRRRRLPDGGEVPAPLTAKELDALRRLVREVERGGLTRRRR